MSDDRPAPFRVLCVDDNEMVADALRRRISQEPRLAWDGVVTDGEAAYATIAQCRPNVVLMDVDIPGVDTFSIVARVAADLPDARVLMLSGHVQPADIDRAIDSGAWGYISKNDDVSELIEGIVRVGNGEIAFSGEVEAVMRNASARRTA
jgi:DNA-binding NarL/FixJ family response regulator